jgi:hypothetical protein
LLVIHVVPQLPPQCSGVGDYATLVARHMASLGTTCVCVAAGHEPVELPRDGESIRNITGRCEPALLWQAVESLAERFEHSTVSVILHYSGYGFDRNGAPEWLVDAMRRRSAKVVTRIATFFHELYADGWPWRRAFWYSSRQQRVAASIAQLSDALVTNREASARWLEARTGRPRGSVMSLPVPSNVGEPQHLPAFTSRPPRAVTFGGEGSKRFALYEEAARVALILKRFEISEFIDIGSKCPIDRRAFGRHGLQVEQLGFLDAAHVTQMLATCRLGFLDYSLDAVGKSGVFAAYVAHGVVPIIRNPASLASDGLEVRRHCLALDDSDSIDSGLLPALSNNGADWYRQHDLHHHAVVLCRASGADYSV